MLGKADSVVAQLKKREEKLRGDIDSLGKVGESSEDQEEHLVTVQDLLAAVRGLQQVPDSQMLERISEVVASMDEDSDGVMKLEHVNKVIEILGSDNVEMSGKQEMLEVESRIERILGKIPSVEPKLSVSKTVIEKDITEKPGDAVVVDRAEELNVEPVEAHIAEMFSRKPSVPKLEAEVEAVEAVEDKDHEETPKSLLVDNSVKDVTDVVKEKEEEAPVKVPQKNGSK